MATQVPSEYQQSLAQLARRRAIADAMAQQSMQPIQTQISGTGSYPIAVQTSPWQVLGQLAQAYGARKSNDKIDQQYGEIAKAMSASRNAEAAKLRAPTDFGVPDYSQAQRAIDAGVDPNIVASTLKPQKDNDPNSVREFEFAKKNGYAGSYEDWTKLSGQTSRPSSVQEWEFYNSLPQEMQAKYLEMKRNPNVFFGKVNEVPTVVKAPTAGVPAVSTPLSTTASEAAAAGDVKRAEAEGGAVGKAQGEITGGALTKGSNATSTKGLLDIAEPLIDVATGSRAGAAYDAVAQAFGGAPDGAKAIASLKVLQAGLMTSMPRMEGPQSDRDVSLYREAAGQIGDPTVPPEIKKAAVGTIRQIQQKYQERAAAAGAPPAPGAPKRVRVDAQGNVIQ